MIVPHQYPDGDALGAATALAAWCSSRQIICTVFCATPIPYTLRFLPFAESITSDPEVWERERYDAVVIVDSGDPVYAGAEPFLSALPYRPILINIDHHPTNTRFGDLNLVVTAASSTSEILYTFFTLNKIPISAAMATSLMTGLITDTGTFTNSATSRLSLAVGGELIKKGADLKTIKRSVLSDKSIEALKLWGIILSRLELEPETGIAYTYFKRHDLEKHPVKEEEADGIANLLNYLSEGRAALVLKERDGGTVKGSFRTTRDDLDVSAWAKKLGGGGHKKAAGFTVAGTVEEVLEKVLAAVRD